MVVGAHTDADDLALLGLFMLADVMIVVQRGPAFCVVRTELDDAIVLDLLFNTLKDIEEGGLLFFVLVDGGRGREEYHADLIDAVACKQIYP